jgi:SPP1 family holin
MKKIDTATAVKAFLFVLTWLNVLLVRQGYNALPVIDETNAAIIVTFVISLYTTITHMFFGRKGQAQKAQLEAQKERMK